MFLKKISLKCRLFLFNFRDTCFSVTFYHFYHVYLSIGKEAAEGFEAGKLPIERGDEVLIL